MANAPNKSFLIGAIFIVAGGLFLMSNLDIIPWDVMDIFFHWQTILIVVGLVMIIANDNKLPGTILLAVGGFFLTREYFQDLAIWGTIAAIFWPALIIVAGILIIARRGSIGKSDGFRIDSNMFNKSTPEEGTDRLNVTAVLGGGDITVQSHNFQGGEVTAFMGGGTYDLSNCELAEGTQVIDVTAIFGGASFIVPSDWTVRIEVSAIFGGFSDSRKKNTLAAPTDNSRELVIKGTVLFGGGEIKNYV